MKQKSFFKNTSLRDYAEVEVPFCNLKTKTFQIKSSIAHLKIMLTLLVYVASLDAFCQIPVDFQVWNYNAGRINSAALVVDSFAFVGDMDGNFSKLNANTGAVIWTYHVPDYIASHAAYKDGTVVFEAGDRLYGLDAETGNFLWSYKSTDKVPTVGYDTGWHHSSPVIEGNTAYYGDEWGNMNGVNVKTGVPDFQYHIPFAYDTLSDYNIRSTAIIDDSIIYFGDYQGRVYAISLRDNSEKWIAKMETPRWDGSIVSDMVIDNGVLYCGRYTNAFIPLDVETGQQLWKFSDWETFLPSTPVFYKDQLIIGTTINSNRIYSLKKETGEKVWELRVKGIFFVRPIIVDDSILVMNSTDPFSDKWGILYFINLENGKIINEMHLENATETSPVYYNGMILIGGNKGLNAFRYKDALGDHGPSSFRFDEATDTVCFDRGDLFSKSWPLVNTGNFCDTIAVNFEVSGGETCSNITFTTRKNYHMRPAQKLDITLKAKANTLNPGNYLVRITIQSARQTIDPLFDKTVNIVVSQKTAVGWLNTPGKCIASPNPFRNRLTFDLACEMTGETNLVISNITGEKLFSLSANDYSQAQKIEWNGCDYSGTPLPGGLYIYTITSALHQISGKIVKTE